jgi:hypothetical protein
MKIFFVIIPAVMCVLSALALIYNKAVAQEVVRKNKSTWGTKLDPVGGVGIGFACIVGSIYFLISESVAAHAVSWFWVVMCSAWVFIAWARMKESAEVREIWNELDRLKSNKSKTEK